MASEGSVTEDVELTRNQMENRCQVFCRKCQAEHRIIS